MESPAGLEKDIIDRSLVARDSRDLIRSKESFQVSMTEFETS